LDASPSYDPDEGADSSSSTGLSFVWLCHRECEQLPEYDSDWQETSPMPEYCAEYKAEQPNNKGCFYNDTYHSSGIQCTQLDYNSQVMIVWSRIVKVTFRFIFEFRALVNKQNLLSDEKLVLT